MFCLHALSSLSILVAAASSSTHTPPTAQHSPRTPLLNISPDLGKRLQRLRLGMPVWRLPTYCISDVLPFHPLPVAMPGPLPPSPSSSTVPAAAHDGILVSAPSSLRHPAGIWTPMLQFPLGRRRGELSWRFGWRCRLARSVLVWRVHRTRSRIHSPLHPLYSLSRRHNTTPSHHLFSIYSSLWPTRSYSKHYSLSRPALCISRARLGRTRQRLRGRLLRRLAILLLSWRVGRGSRGGGRACGCRLRRGLR